MSVCVLSVSVHIHLNGSFSANAGPAEVHNLTFESLQL